MHLLPAIDILGGQAVRLAKGDYHAVTVYNQDPVAQARIFEADGAEWLHVVDLDGARTGKQENLAIIQRIVKETGLKVEVGGGVRNREAVENLANAGASRIVLGTVLVKDPDFAQAAVEEYGDLLAAGIDARDGKAAISGWEKDGGISADDLKKCIIAYEPVWAIGTGKTATADQAEEVCAFIRATLAKLYGADVAETITIQYGGSMNAKNAEELLSKTNVDGGLIGGASLKAADFTTIIKAAVNG